jgi:uncharacterized protein (TIGR00369 family)
MANHPDLEKLNRMIADSPYHQVLRIRVESIDENDETVTLRLPFDARIERNAGSNQHHGGVIASLIDIAGDFALIWKLGYGVPTINFRTDYIRPAFDTDLIAHAHIRRIGRTIAVCDIDVVNEDGKLIATGRGCYSSIKG